MYANNVEIARNLTNAFPHPYTLENAQNFIAMTLSAQPIHVFGIEVNGQIAGAWASIPKVILCVKTPNWAIGWQNHFGAEVLLRLWLKISLIMVLRILT